MKKQFAKIFFILTWVLFCVLGIEEYKVEAADGLVYVENQPLQPGTYIINSVDGWIALQKYSKEQDLSQCTFEYLLNDTSSTYDLTIAKGFTGVGSKEHPFSGTIITNYTSGNIVLKTEKPLFQYLSTAAKVNKMNIQVNGSECLGGLAQYLVADQSLTPLDLNGITITGTTDTYITTNNAEDDCKYAGGFFAHVINEQTNPVTIQFSNVSLSVPVKVPVDGLGAGGWIGHISGKMVLSFAKDYEITNTVIPCDNAEGNVLGGLVGCVENSDVTLQTTGTATVSCSADIGTDSNRKQTAGSVFGKVVGSHIQMDADLQVTGGKLYGRYAGGFAGEIDTSNITWNHTFIRKQSILYPAASSGEESGWSAVGMFVGKMTASNIMPGDKLSGNVATLYGGDVTGSYSVVGKATNSNNTEKYHVGGFAGYVENSDILLTAEHGLDVVNFTTDGTAGNISAGIGCYVANDAAQTAHKIQFIHVKDQNNTRVRLVSWRGNCGGLIGKAVVNQNSQVELSDCNFNVVLVETCSGAGDNGTWSMGIGYLDNPDCSDSLFGIRNVDCRITNANKSTNFGKGFVFVNKTLKLEAYGGIIGIADADVQIDGVVLDHSVSDMDASNVSNYGGLFGVIKNQAADTNTLQGRVRKVSVSNVSIGRNAFYNIRDNFGGLFGKVEKKTAVSLTGTMELNGGSDGVPKQSVSVSKKYLGSVAGFIDNALIYLEPDIVWHPSDSIKSNEIGNYGAVIRNQIVGDTKLIDNYQVTGTIGSNIDSVVDLLRLAIVLNTQGAFMPTGNTTDTFDTIRAKAYTLTQNAYDLTDSGLTCMGRNDSEGLKYPFTGSLKGVSGGTTIQYHINGYGKGQTNLGLFPAVGDGASFENITLNYEIAYLRLEYYTNNWYYQVPDDEHAGGLACFASGDITLKNVRYIGKMKDYPQEQYKISNKKFNGDYDYLGGLIGQYTGANGKQLVMESISGSMTDFTCQDPTHIMGGVIGIVNTDQVAGTTSDTSCRIELSGMNSIDGNITFSETNDTKNKTGLSGLPAMVSSFITVIGKPDQTGGSLRYTGRCRMQVNNLTMTGITQNITSGNNASAMGGLLGYQWADVNAGLDEIAIGDESSPVALSGNAGFGGLLHGVYGRIDASQITWKKASIDAKNTSGVDNCALFVRDGQYLYLSVKDYVVESGVALSNYSGTCFDELVGFNRGGSDENHGGIVSISSSSGKYLGKGGSSYQSYDAKVGATDKKNTETRYYYDLDTLVYPAASDDYAVLDSPEDIMIWHLLHYVNPNIRKTVSDSVPDSLPTEYTITGSIDMTGYSIYPTPVEKESYQATGATIILNVQDMITGEQNKSVPMYPDDKNYQHYRMQSGLFYDVAGLSVEGLTLSGTYSAFSTDSNVSAGALVSGKIYGLETGKDSNNKTLYDATVKNAFQNITLSNLWCVSSSSMDYANPVGLMIANIASGSDVALDGIAMTNYQDGDVTQSKKAASALIGNVGGAKATYITLSFKNMDIADAAQGKSSDGLHSSTQDEALSKASFIYSYDYEANCTGIYLFDYADYREGRIVKPSTKKITLGEELGDNNGSPNYAVEEYFDKDMPVGQLLIHSDEIAYASENYLPYVSQKINDRHILVNPKVGNITKGCGTYEDPYQISSTRQMLSLYRYLYKEADFANILQAGNWSINAMGTDETFCDGSDVSHTLQTYADKESGFPTTEQLSQAYYQITGDLDFSAYPEFTGFGSEQYPFIGVFVGKVENSKYPVITMSKQNSAEMASYGFIQNAKGCVVKNLCIQYAQPVQINAKVTKTDDKTNQEVTVDEGGTGGGVIATVLGGENIIDHVIVKGAVASANSNVECFNLKNTKAVVGGYVGMVQRGGVILRNVDVESLQQFTVYYGAPTDSNVTASDYIYTCSMVGRVKDGYVVYDGEQAGNTKEVLRTISDFSAGNVSGNTESNTATTLPLSRSYAVVNGAYLDSQITADEKIVYSTTGYSVPNAAGLQVLSMALDSGVLTYKGSDNKVAYSVASRQRHGNYDNVGNSTADDDNRKNVILSDNFTLNGTFTQQYGSFLSQYVSFSSDTIWASGSYSDGTGVLALNQEGKNYNLTGTTYDMSVFGTAFRGLGARYFEEDNVFRCNLAGPDGTPAVIKLHMIVDGIQDVTDAALLNNVITTTASITISNITLSGSIENKSEIEEENISETDQKRNAAGFVSTLKVKNGITFHNVSLNDLTVNSQGYAGGLVAYDNNNKTITLTNCGINTEADIADTVYTIVTGMSDVGGLIGYTNSEVTCTLSAMNHLKVTSGNVSASEGQKDTGGNAGGLVARIDDRILKVNQNDAADIVYGDCVTVQSAGIPSKIGGLVGWCKSAYVNRLTLTNVHIENVYDGPEIPEKDINKDNDNLLVGIAGVVGYIPKSGVVTMRSVTVGSDRESDSVTIGMHLNKLSTNFGGIGGLVGRTGPDNTELTLTDCHIKGCKKADGSYTAVISGGVNVGGMVSNTRTFTGDNLSVENVKLETSRYVGGIIGYHEVDKTCTLKNVKSTNVHIVFLCQGFQDGGVAGGICGQAVGNISLQNASVDGLVVEPQYCNAAGGFAGVFGSSYNHNGTMKVDGDNNSVKNSKICGGIVGGGIGYIYYNHEKKTNIHQKITIHQNMMIAYQNSLWKTNNVAKDFGTGSAGGYIGANGSKSTNLDMDDVTIEGNLIAGYSGNSTGNVLYLGGLEGRAKNAADIYNLRLQDNYIGMMKGSDTSNDNLSSIKAMNVSNIDTWKEQLYYVQYSDGTYKYNTTAHSTDLNKETQYQYSYQQGTMIGYYDTSGSNEAFSRMINVSVAYTDPAYRPVSDVGMDPGYNLTSNQDMYGKSREFAAIVYDGEAKNHKEGVKLPEGLPDDMQTFIGIDHYIFGNLEHIMTDSNQCYYWLNKNYQKNGWLDDTAETKDVLSISNIYKNTYKDNNGYKSKLKINGTIIPMVVYDSADSGSLDEVIESYINILTNNSGALNSKVAANNNSLAVTTHKIRIRTVDSTTSISIEGEEGDTSVQYKKGDDLKTYQFETASQGDELDPDTGEGTFTLVHIVYNDTNGNPKWSLDIPVYVEKRLKIYSNMRMLSGTRYDSQLVKTEGKFMTDGDDNSIVLPMGTGYTIYCEYVYADILEGMTNISIPKTFVIDGRNDQTGTTSDISFIRGSEITLIPMDNQNHPGVPYYYTVSTEGQTEINFEDFKDASGASYVLENIVGMTKKETYTDVCNASYSNVAVEQFMIYVNPPEIDKTEYSLYKLHVEPKQLSTESEYNNLRTRTDYAEHCYERVNELPGVKYNIVDDATALASDSKLTKNGSVKLSLQYNVTASSAYWKSTRSEDLYLDIALYLKKKPKGSTSTSKVALPAGTVVSYGDADTAVIGANQENIYYYQGINSGKTDKTYIQINKLSDDIKKDISFQLDFSNADMSAFETDTESQYSVVAELIVTPDKEMPASGDVKDTWEAYVTAEAKDEIGFALEAENMMTLGMNQYKPEETDSGVVPYTASIAFPEKDNASFSSKMYTIVYQIEKKTSRQDADGKPVYETYTGPDVSLYLGNMDVSQGKAAASNATDSVTSGKGLVAVSYQFKDTDITTGLDLQDGQTPSSEHASKNVIRTHCTLVANCDKLAMTNYRVRAYLIVSDDLSSLKVGGSAISSVDNGDNVECRMKGQLVRQGNWPKVLSGEISKDAENDFFVITVAKLKTDMQ